MAIFTKVEKILIIMGDNQMKNTLFRGDKQFWRRVHSLLLDPHSSNFDWMCTILLYIYIYSKFGVKGLWKAIQVWNDSNFTLNFHKMCV